MSKKIIVIIIFSLFILSNFFSVLGVVNSTDIVYDPKNIDTGSQGILWWYNLSAPSFGSAAANDIDGDNKPEIVFGTYFNDENIYALNAEDGSLLWKYNTGGCNDASPVIYDVDLDGELEVIIPASSPYMVYCFNGLTGDVEWSRSTGYPNCIDSPPAIADVDNDLKPEIILGTFYGYVFCLNGEDGSIYWQKNFGSDSYIQSCPDILDLDLDGQLDIVVAQFAGDCRVYALKGDDGSVLWYSDLPQDYMYHGGSFADIDEDGKPEIVIGCYDNTIYVFNGEDGSLEWDYTSSYYIAAPTSIADLNNDGHLEIVFASNNILVVLSHTGSLLWSYPTGGSIFRGASIADVDGDGTLDVCFGSSDGILRVLNGDNGQEVWTYNLQSHYGNTFNIDNAPIICDFDNDGKLDIFVVGGYGTSSPSTNNHGRAYALSAGDGTGPGWPMFRHDERHSACFDNNEAPNIISIDGPTIGIIGVEYIFTIVAADPNNDSIYYRFDWGDGNVEEWVGPYDSGKEINISHTWSSIGNYDIKAKCKDTFNKESIWSDSYTFIIINNSPPDTPNINGSTHFKPNQNKEYNFFTTDHDGDKIYYYIDWDDGTNSDWIGPYESEYQLRLSHTWTEKSAFTIRCKAKDINGLESDYGTLDISTPRSKIINSNFLILLENHSYLTQLLQKILKRL
jgi:outer membrane protein assembly factor BamB